MSVIWIFGLLGINLAFVWLVAHHCQEAMCPNRLAAEYAEAPKAPGQTSQAATAAKNEFPKSMAQLRLPHAAILLVDDMRVNLEVARGMMLPYDMHIDCVTSGAEAVEAIRRADVKYSAVFMDHMMPGINGIEATRIIREEIGTEYAKTVPIIALTANTISGNEEIFLSKGFQAYLSKPVDLFRLDQILRQFVRDIRPEEALTKKHVLTSGIPEQAETDHMLRAQGTNLREETVCGGHLKGSLFAGGGIEGLDLAGALRKFGSENVIVRILQTFAGETPALLEQMRRVTPESLRDYAIIAHSLKGSCFGIFAQSLGGQAKRLEDAARAGQYSIVMEYNAGFIRDTENLLAQMQSKLAAATVKKRKTAPDTAVLEELLVASMGFDIDSVDDAMSELTSFEYENNEELIQWLTENVKNMGFKQITERLSQMLG